MVNPEEEQWAATEVLKDTVWYVGIEDPNGGRWNLATVRHRNKGKAEEYAKRIAKLPELESRERRACEILIEAAGCRSQGAPRDVEHAAEHAAARIAELEAREKRIVEGGAESLTEAKEDMARKDEEILELHRLIASMTPRVPHGDGLRDEVEAAFRVMDPGTPCSVSLTARCAQLVDEITEQGETNEALRESLQRCLDTMAKFDSTNYDDHGGPHLADGIQKLGQKAARRDILRGEVTGD